jgi:uncharacterized protein (TIGR02246 family)
MMLRLHMIMALLAIMALPAGAQPISDGSAWQAGESVVQAHNAATKARDAAGVAALYAEDAIMVTPDGTLSGRDAIEKAYAEDFKVITAEPARLVKVIMIGDSVRLRTGTWGGTLQGPNGPVPLKGNWTTTDVRDGSIWKIRMETDNVITPPPPDAGK